MAVSHVPPPSAAAKVSSDTVERAINALLKWRTNKSKTQKPQLLDLDEDFIYLVLTLNKIPAKSRTNAHKIPLPHPLHKAGISELCLIIDDRHKGLTSDAAKSKINSENIPVTKVLKLSKLKSDYKPFEAKRKLCDSHDMFLVDKRVVHLLPKLLGKQFFKKSKIPVPVDLTHKNWKEQVERACSSGLLYLRSGTCSVVRVGKASMGSGEIAENVVAAVEGVVGVVPRKWAGVRSFHLKFSESLALPIYQVLPDVKLKIEGKPKKKEESKEKEKEKEKEKGVLKKKGRIHEVRYMDGEVDEDEDVGGEENANDDVGGLEFGGKKRKKRDFATSTLNGEKILKKSASKGEKEKEVLKKKGRIHEVRYMDGEVGEDEVDEEDVEGGEESENDDVGGSKFGVKKRKKGGLVTSKLNGEKEKGVLKKKGRIYEVRYMDGEVGEDEDGEDIVEEGGEQRENDDVGGSEFGGKKRKKGDSVTSKLKKSASKGEKGDESFEKKVKKKGGVDKLKDAASKVRHKKSKKA